MMRDKRIDFYKGMLMLCVVYGHAINSFLGPVQHSQLALHAFIRTFDMPFFMMLSGYFLKRSLERRSALNVALNRVSMILFPVAVWTLLSGHVAVHRMYYFLWAVFASGMICIVAGKSCSFAPERWRKAFEFVLYLLVTVLLHLVNVPWNIFYLFPFFAAGCFVSDAKFNLTASLYWIVAAAFVVGLCFWTTAWTPWRIGATAWRDDCRLVAVYVYRFALGVAGVFVMARVFDAIRNMCGEESFFARKVTECGSETLALYILQSIVVERIIGRLCVMAYGRSGVELPPGIVNLVAYFIAPLFAFITIVVLLYAIKLARRTVVLKHVFGFKIK